jgi:hypothetical protein
MPNNPPNLMWPHIWAVFDSCLTQYETTWNYLNWDIQKRVIEHVVSLCYIGKSIDWSKFWNDIEPLLNTAPGWEEQQLIIQNSFDFKKYCSNKHIMDKPRILRISFSEHADRGIRN